MAIQSHDSISDIMFYILRRKSLNIDSSDFREGMATFTELYVVSHDVAVSWRTD